MSLATYGLSLAVCARSSCCLGLARGSGISNHATASHWTAVRPELARVASVEGRFWLFWQHRFGQTSSRFGEVWEIRPRLGPDLALCHIIDDERHAQQPAQTMQTSAHHRIKEAAEHPVCHLLCITRRGPARNVPLQSKQTCSLLVTFTLILFQFFSYTYIYIYIYTLNYKQLFILI